MAAFDLLVVGNARFQGDTTAAMVSDVTAFSALGARVGLMFLRSAYLDDSRDPPNLAARNNDGVFLGSSIGIVGTRPLTLRRGPVPI